MKLAANLSWLYTDLEFEQRLAACAVDGFRHAECMFPYEYPAEMLRAKAQDAGVQWILINAPAGSWVQGDRGLAADLARRDEFKHAAEQAANYARVLGVGKVHVLAGLVDSGAVSARDRAWDCYTENLEWLATTMQAEPVDWLIEPINAFDMPGYLLSRQADAHNLLEQLGKGNLGVQMDLYHCQRTESNALEALSRYLPTGRVKHLQVAGVPDRGEPGFGQGSVLDYAEVYRQLQNLGYKGHIGCEYRPKAATRDGLGWIQSTGFSGTMESFKS